jgi:F-type H+-transporting ATPase subunit b
VTSFKPHHSIIPPFHYSIEFKESIVSETAQTNAFESVPGIPDVIHRMPSDVMQVSGQMVVLTWVAFLIAAICLHKLLWKPILKAVGAREKSVSDAMEGAERARNEIGVSQAQCKTLIRQAEDKSLNIADQAMRNASLIVSKADDDARLAAARRVQEAERKIELEYRKSFEALRLDASTTMLDAMEKMLRLTLTDEQKKVYQSVLLSEVKL